MGIPSGALITDKLAGVAQAALTSDAGQVARTPDQSKEPTQTIAGLNTAQLRSLNLGPGEIKLLTDSQQDFCTRLSRLVGTLDPALASLIPNGDNLSQGLSLRMCAVLGLIPELADQVSERRALNMILAIESNNWKELAHLISSDIQHCKRAGIDTTKGATVAVLGTLAQLKNWNNQAANPDQLTQELNAQTFCNQFASINLIKEHPEYLLKSAQSALGSLLLKLPYEVQSQLWKVRIELAREEKRFARSDVRDPLLRMSSATDPSSIEQMFFGAIETLAPKYLAKVPALAASAALLFSSSASANPVAPALQEGSKQLFGGEISSNTLEFVGGIVALGALFMLASNKAGDMLSKTRLKAFAYRQDWSVQLLQGIEATATEAQATYRQLATERMNNMFGIHFKEGITDSQAVPVDRREDGFNPSERFDYRRTLLLIDSWARAAAASSPGQIPNYKNSPDQDTWRLSDKEVFYLTKMGILDGDSNISIIKNIINPNSQFSRSSSIGRALVGSCYEIRSDIREEIVNRVKDRLSKMFRDPAVYRESGGKYEAIRQEMADLAALTRAFDPQFSYPGQYFRPWGHYCPGRWLFLEEGSVMDENVIYAEWEELKAKAASGNRDAINEMEETYRVLMGWEQAHLTTSAKEAALEWMARGHGREMPKPLIEITEMISRSTNRGTGAESVSFGIPESVHEFFLDKQAAYLYAGIYYHASERGIVPDKKAIEELQLGRFGFQAGERKAELSTTQYLSEIRELRQVFAHRIKNAPITGLYSRVNWGDYARQRQLVDLAVGLALLKCVEDVPGKDISFHHVNAADFQRYFIQFNSKIRRLNDKELSSMVDWMTNYSGIFQMADYFAQFAGALSVWINTISTEPGENQERKRDSHLKTIRAGFISMRMSQFNDRQLAAQYTNRQMTALDTHDGWRRAAEQEWAEFNTHLTNTLGAGFSLSEASFQRGVFDLLHRHLGAFAPPPSEFDRIIEDGRRNGISRLNFEIWRDGKISEFQDSPNDPRFGLTDRQEAEAMRIMKNFAVASGNGARDSLNRPNERLNQNTASMVPAIDVRGLVRKPDPRGRRF